MRVDFIIDGAAVRAASRATFVRKDPVTGAVASVHDEGQTPFGGVKASGYGRFGGKAVIAEFTDLRWITVEGPQHYPF
jgi:hypothetical protein